MKRTLTRSAALLLPFFVACSAARQDVSRSVWGEERSDPAKLQARHEAAVASGDTLMAWLTADILARRRPEEQAWAEARADAEARLGGGTERVPDVLKFRLREARAERRSAEAALEATPALDLLGMDNEVEELDRVSSRLQMASIHLTLLAEERERVADRAGQSMTDELAKEAEALERKARAWRTERAKLEARKEALEHRLASIRRRIPTAEEKAAVAARAAKAREQEESVRFDMALLEEWKNTPAAPRSLREPVALRPPPPEEIAAEPPRDEALAAPAEEAAVRQEPPPLPEAEPELVLPEEAEEEVLSAFDEPEILPVPDDPPSASSRRPVKAAAPPRAPSSAPSVAAAAALYQVQRGDTLPSVAAKHYGDPDRWKEIYDVNAYQIMRGLLQPGQWLLIPGGR